MLKEDVPLGAAAARREARHDPPGPSGLFEPGFIGGVQIRNRIVMPAMTTRCADKDGFVTPDVEAYYLARARGGVGLVTLEMAAPEPIGRHRRFELGIHHDKFVPGLARLCKKLHDTGARIAIQLGHAGGHTQVSIAGGTPVAPSAIPHIVQEGHAETVMPQEMSHEQIERTIEAFVEAAARARTAGIDIVEIHAAHGYLLSQFLTPAENLRQDEFGGSLENRARMGLEIIRRIKARVPGLPVIYRLNGDDFFPQGMPFGEAEQVAVMSVAAGADAVHVTAGHYRSLPSASIMIPPMAQPEATFIDFAASIRKLVNVPVIAVGRLGDPVRAMRAIDEGEADFIALGRPLLADAEWVSKARANLPVRTCIACNTCVDTMREGSRLHCLVNPATGRERQFGNMAADQKLKLAGKRIAVIGAGPAGLSYASLASRQNRVTVFDKAPRAGGAFILAGHAPLFQNVEANLSPMAKFIADLEKTCMEQGAEFHFSCDPLADVAMLDGFDEVVVAVGARYRLGLGSLVTKLLKDGIARWPVIRAIAANGRVRDWFYYRARRANRAAALLPGHLQGATTIGDAVSPGKTAAAIHSAFTAALEAQGPEALEES